MRALLFALLLPAGLAAAEPPDAPSPAAVGFRRYFKCIDFDAISLGDTETAKGCLAACSAVPHAAGCWWLDGTGSFPRECRICRTHPPVPFLYPNDWAQPLAPKIIARAASGAHG